MTLPGLTQIVSYRVDKFISSNTIDTFIVYSFPCSGSGVSMDSCEYDEPHYLFWQQNGKFFLKRFDYCKTYRTITLDTINPLTFYLKNRRIIDKEQIRQPTYYEIRKHKATIDSIICTSTIDHSCYHTFQLPLNKKTTYIHADIYNLDFKVFDNGKKNIYYNYNQKTKFKALIDLTTTLIKQLENDNKFETESLNMRVLKTPAPVKTSNKTMYCYELLVTNSSPDTVQLKDLNIYGKNDDNPYLSVRNAELTKRFSLIGITKEAPVEPFIYPGITAVIYIEFPLEREQTKIEVVHQIYFERKGDEKVQTYAIEDTFVKFSNQPEIILGNPLRGGPWCAVYDPFWARGHRRVIYTINGKARIPGRFAIDFIKLNENGKYASGNEDSIKEWFGYNAAVLAVADGVIAAAIDSFSESQTLSAHPQYSSDKATGNYISLKIKEHQFVFYEHLKSKSIRVKPGQFVKKGDVIAFLGFTGQTTGPHLHIHVADNNSSLGAEGLPFVFENFTILGSYENFENFGKDPWTKPPPNDSGGRIKQRPQPKAVIEFKN